MYLLVVNALFHYNMLNAAINSRRPVYDPADQCILYKLSPGGDLHPGQKRHAFKIKRFQVLSRHDALQVKSTSRRTERWCRISAAACWYSFPVMKSRNSLAASSFCVPVRMPA